MRNSRTVLVATTAALAVGLLGPMPAAAKGPKDISDTASGRAMIATAAASFEAQGSPVPASRLTATQLPDGAVLVFDTNYEFTASATGVRVVPRSAPPTELMVTEGASAAAIVPLAAPSWSQIRGGCFAALFRGAAHFDVCHKQFKMLSDGDGGKDYWRVDLYGTMFSEGRTLKWGWIHIDRDAGPALRFVDWAPEGDYDAACGNVTLGLTVAGFGITQGGTFCEFVDLSKTAGPDVGWIKEQWSYGSAGPKPNRDRAVKLLVGFSSTQGGGTPVWGLSWDFYAYN